MKTVNTIIFQLSWQGIYTSDCTDNGGRVISARSAGWAPFPIFILFFELWRINNEAGNSLNAVERKPVPTRVLNPNASEASYKPKQRSYRKTKPKKKLLLLFFFSGGFCRGILSWNRLDYVKNSRTLSLIYKYGLYRKDVLNKIIFFFDFTVVSQNLVQIGPLVKDTLNLWKKICSTLYDAYLLQNYGKYQKTSAYKMLCNFIRWMNSCKFLM